MKFLTGFFFVFWLVGVLFNTPALAAKRIALVIGNSAYTNVPALTNPKNDAELMAATLRSVGFEVALLINADRRKMGRAVRRFGKTLRAAGQEAVGLFYFAGHGNQAKGVNYLIPLDAEIESVADLEVEALSASNILSQMEDAGNTLNLVILDACRDNPYKGRVRSSARGLAKVQAASGSLVAFSAAPGQVAVDGIGDNSPYTAALVKAIKQPGLELGKVFRVVRKNVEEQTKGRQTPWEESSLKGDFHFVPQSNQITSGQTSKSFNTSQPSIKRDVEIAYLRVVEKDSLEEYERFLAEFPNHSRSVIIRRIVKTRSDDRVWQRTRKKNTRAAYQQYLIIFPDGEYKDDAKTRLAALSANTIPKSVEPPQNNQQQVASVNFYRVIDHADWDVLNVRRGPGTKYNKLFGIPYNARNVTVYTCRQVSGFSYRWCHVKHEGRQGWAYGRYLVHVRTGNHPR